LPAATCPPAARRPPAHARWPLPAARCHCLLWVAWQVLVPLKACFAMLCIWCAASVRWRHGRCLAIVPMHSACNHNIHCAPPHITVPPVPACVTALPAMQATARCCPRAAAITCACTHTSRRLCCPRPRHSSMLGLPGRFPAQRAAGAGAMRPPCGLPVLH